MSTPKQALFESVQWLSHDETPNPLVRKTDYMEVSNLQNGTSGCSRKHPYWQWSSCGVLQSKHGKLLVTPGDYIVKIAEYENEEIFIVLDEPLVIPRTVKL